MLLSDIVAGSRQVSLAHVRRGRGFPNQLVQMSQRRVMFLSVKQQMSEQGNVVLRTPVTRGIEAVCKARRAIAQ